MANKFFEQLGGVITLRLKGKHQERIINMALSRGIYIWDIKWHGDDLQMQVRSSGFKALQNIAAENDFEIEVVSKQGLPFYRSIIKRRMGFLSGAALFIMALYLMSSFIWFIQLSGNKTVEPKRILLSAARHGIYQGAAKWNFSCNDVEEAMLRDLPKLSYVQCEVRGVKVHINVVEKVVPNDEIRGPCHIVAAKDGVVEEVLVLEGQANVQAGQVVGKGDILISGIVFPPAPYAMDENAPPPSSEPYPVRARGTVKARIWYEGYGECPLSSETKIFTGRTKTAVYIITPWKKICLKGDGSKKYVLEKSRQSKSILNTPAGKWGYIKKVTREQRIKVSKYTEENAIEIAREQAVKKLRQNMKNNFQINDSHVEVLSSPSDSIVRIKVSVESIEDISQAQAFDSGEISN